MSSSSFAPGSKPSTLRASMKKSGEMRRPVAWTVWQSKRSRSIAEAKPANYEALRQSRLLGIVHATSGASSRFGGQELFAPEDQSAPSFIAIEESR
jgi:hypothetical protein